MKYPTLPQVCCRCRKLKAPVEGRFIKSRHKFNRWLWLCATCEQSSIRRENRQGRESHYEKIVREALQAVFPHLGIKAERRLGPYIFDFAVEDLRLLIEINPHSTHSRAARKIRDWKKAKVAEQNGWTLVQLVPYPTRHLARMAILAVRKHCESMFPKSQKPGATSNKRCRNESKLDRLVRRWTLLFEHRYGFKYVFKAGDVEALEAFLSQNPGVSTRKIEGLAFEAWQRAKVDTRRFYHSAGASSLQFFAKHIEEILNELGYGNRHLFTKAWDVAHLEKLPIRCDKCGHQWEVFEDVLQATCPRCRAVTEGPLARPT